MTTQIKRRRGTTLQHSTFAGAEAEITIDTDKNTVVVHDGSTAGGHPLAKASEVVAKAGDTMTGNLSFGDNDKATFGDGADLQIYHDGSNSYVRDNGDGNLRITSDSQVFIAKHNDENMLRATADGAVDLYYDGSSKLATTNTGVDVTGTITSDGLTVNGAATTDSFDLAAIAASKADTAVDVFVYDTSKDSDGGAWRKRTQATSWYNETLNTATRGSRREFPAVAVIVAEADQIVIYDGDDPALPMWMIFLGGSIARMAHINGGSYTPTSVMMKNGHLVTGNSLRGIIDISFASDTALMYRESTAATVSGYRSGGIVSRNVSDIDLWDGTDPFGAIINDTVNDVAMTVLPNAPIDPATGLPVPTIAVATAGGVSVIKDDGTVVDITRTSSAQTASVDFNNGYLVIGNSNVGAVWYYDYIPSSDETISPSNGHIEYYDSGFSNDDTPAYLGYLNTKTAGTYIGTTGANDAGLTAVDFNPADYSKSSTAWITSDYNTGWMNGDIKGAFLSDTDDTDLVGSELVTNGDFSSALSGTWTTDLGSSSGGTVAIVSGELVITQGTNSVWMGAWQSLDVTGIDTVTISAQRTAVDVGTARVGLATGSGASSSTPNIGYLEFTGTTTGTKAVTIDVSSYTTVYLSIREGSGAGDSSTLDNISVRLADEDRSVNGNGLQVFGTVTRTPVATGADLVAYSGFSTSNYLEQPYNSDLDFGTGDFCYMGWFKTNGTGITMFERCNSPRSGNGMTVYMDGTGKPLWYKIVSGVPTIVVTPTAAYNNNSWVHFAAIRQNGVVSLYFNGQKDGSASDSTDMTNTSAIFRLGANATGTSGWTGSLALWRISATAPTAEQISRIYNDEKHLFTEGAQATLFGSSDAVTALAFDDSSQLLHVGTSAGRSVFQGLRRVSNTTTAVGTAISASNGLVVEE
jgi:hypothetical protein